MVFFYYLATQAYYLAIRIAALHNSKARLAIRGRQKVFSQLRQYNFREEKWIWVHCASLGEFEQGRPLIEELKDKNPDHRIILTFFSPSGYEIRKNYPYADLVTYLPFDTPGNAKKFINTVHPSIAIFIKYEFWHFYLKTLKKRNVPTFLVSSIFREKQIFFKWYGVFFKRLLQYFTHIFVQNRSSMALLENAGFKNCILSGDTRVDRVKALADSASEIPVVAAFSGHSRVMIAGSTWPPDEAILCSCIEKFQKELKFIIAPHEIGEEHIKKLEERLPVPAVRYSGTGLENIHAYHVLIIDNIGMLASLYQYGDMAYIGGGFGKGIHNLLEPIAFGLPVIFGPNFQKFEEAIRLLKSGGGFSVHSAGDCEKNIRRLLDDSHRTHASKAAKEYIQSNSGATSAIYNFLRPYLSS